MNRSLMVAGSLVSRQRNNYSVMQVMDDELFTTTSVAETPATCTALG